MQNVFSVKINLPFHKSNDVEDEGREYAVLLYWAFQAITAKRKYRSTITSSLAGNQLATRGPAATMIATS